MFFISQLEHEKYFNYLLSSVSNCDICKRMCTRRKIFSLNNGNLYSKVIFIAEAPGRLGADCTGIPLYGDKTGDNFEMLLGNIGWRREDIFITNSILCNPQDENGNNATPTQEEMENCSYFLKMTLELINPDLIVTLGVKALEALKYIKDHNYILRETVAKKLSWNNKYLFPLYHMGPRATIHRGIIKQRADFIALSHIIDPIKGLKFQQSKVKNYNKNTIRLDSMLLDITVIIITELKIISFFKLTKLIYLIDYHHYKDYGYTISGGIYLRMQDGPWIPSLKYYTIENKRMFSINFEKRKPLILYKKNKFISHLSDEQKQYIQNIIIFYKDFSDKAIKLAAYRTEPMKYILNEEKKGRNMTKIPVLYKDSSVIEMDKINGALL